MSISEEFLLVVLLLSSIIIRSVHAMESEDQGGLSNAHQNTSMVFQSIQNLRTQLILSVFIVMRVDLGNTEEAYWEEESIRCAFCHEVDSYGCVSDIYFVRRLLDHLHVLSDPGAERVIELLPKHRQIIAAIAYETLCTLSSLGFTRFDDDQCDFIQRLFDSYRKQESLTSVEISMQDIGKLLDMSKMLLLKILDFKFLRSYPCNYSEHHRFGEGKVYLERQRFFCHYIQAHCHNVNSKIMYRMLDWFRQETQNYSPEEIYCVFLDFFMGNSLSERQMNRVGK